MNRLAAEVWLLTSDWEAHVASRRLPSPVWRGFNGFEADASGGRELCGQEGAEERKEELDRPLLPLSNTLPCVVRSVNGKTRQHRSATHTHYKLSSFLSVIHGLRRRFNDLKL